MASDQRQKSTLVSKNITILGRRTSVRLEPEMWDSLYDVARRERTSIHNVCSLIYLRKVKQSTLTAAIRVFLLLYFRAASTEDGHAHVHHGNFENMKARARVTEVDLCSENQKLFSKAV
ncbi:MAG: ribbon-helix-helix domain-containing protein [Alphaproteobacteria bacterium]|nr:ribbon-helix-helix domain-containing protein [Alphaproteobacteria bacterium]MCB1551078.1 ribbon-helix-helix domain-containing protein [Alphaproteobacteria bacterium]MCB9984814.1 ribbon-helix-helix domain-containing protein [Micavibrio sp.]